MNINNLQSLERQQEFFHRIGTDIIPSGIFERFPELIPCVGVNYERADGKHKKLLFIGESNYFDKELEAVSVFQDANEWYMGNTNRLIPEAKRKAVSNDTGYKPFVRVFNQANTFLKNNGVEPAGDRLTETVFYNYFLRPALNPGSGKAKKIKPEEIDREVAGTALCGIIERLKPHVIVFLSKFSFVAFKQYLNCKNQNYTNISNIDIRYNSIEIHGLVHPSSIWWYRNNGAYGWARLEKILKGSWL